ncbi:MAG: RsmE family RNA methyltransferase [Victivallaceae bacterium]
MNAVVIEQSDFATDNLVRLTGRRFVHLQKVLKLGVGDQCRVSVCNLRSGFGVVTELGSDYLLLQLDLTHELPPPLPLTLICALQRPKTMRKMLYTAVSCGVKDIHVIESWKVEKGYWNSPLLNEGELAELVNLALEQSGEAGIPQITFHRRFKAFAEDELPRLIAGKVALVGEPKATQPCPINLHESVCLILGPEGGFTDYEVNLLAAQGVTPISLGRRILRSEVALAALIGRIFAELI